MGVRNCSATMSSLQGQIQSVKTISGLSLAGIIIILVLFLFLLYKQGRAEPKVNRDMEAGQLPDPAVFDLDIISRGNNNADTSSTRIGNNTSPRVPDISRGLPPRRPAQTRDMTNTSTNGKHKQSYAARSKQKEVIPASPLNSHPMLKTSNTGQSFGTDYSKVRRAGRFDDEYHNAQRISNTRGIVAVGSSSREGGSRSQRMQDKIENQ